MESAGTNPVIADFFAEIAKDGGVVVQALPKFDLDLYIQNYTGATRFERLLLIGRSCVPLCVNALKLAIFESKKGSDVSRYKEAWELIREAAPDDPDAVRDDDWIDKTDRANKLETARLETELKGYRNNLIKESIRMGHEDLGKHFESIGRYNEATEAYNRMRQDVSSSKQIVEYGMHLVDIGLRRRDWSMVQSSVAKITGNIGENDNRLSNYVNLVAGIASLGLKNYSDATMYLLRMHPRSPFGDYSHIASPNDLAMYGGLLALATLDRNELQSRVLQSTGFRPILDYEPSMRKAVSLFYNGRYSDSLAILEAFMTDGLLDIYLQRHLKEIFKRIRSRCIIHYFTPFSCVTIESLSAAFGTLDSSLEDELVEMIRNGQLNARIDAKNKLLVAVRPDARLELQKEALRVARKYEAEAQERLRRISLVAAGLEVTASNSRPPKAEDSTMGDIAPRS